MLMFVAVIMTKYFFLCMPNGIRKCMYSSGRKNVNMYRKKEKSMEPSQNGNLNIFKMCFPFAKKK